MRRELLAFVHLAKTACRRQCRKQRITQISDFHFPSHCSLAIKFVGKCVAVATAFVVAVAAAAAAEAARMIYLCMEEFGLLKL